MKKLIIFLLTAIYFIGITINPIVVQASKENQFSDVKEKDWFYNDVMELTKKGLVSGYPDNSFKPNVQIRVDEFIKILVSSIDENVKPYKNGYWAYSYIQSAKELGIVKDGEFQDYTKYITRGEMARMIVRLGVGDRAKEKGISLEIPENYKEYASLITDYSTLDPASQDIALKIFTSGIITGFSDGSFGFDKTATRAEACAILIRFLEKDQRKIPILPQKSDLEEISSNHITEEKTEIDKYYEQDFFINNNDDLSITTKLKGYTSFHYPDMGREHILGPEKTVYYAIHYDGNGEVKYGEIIREADDFVLERVYPDGTYEEFTPPELTEKQKQDFINKYDPKKVKERMEEEEKELKKKVEERYNRLIKEGLVVPIIGDNYIIDMCMEPSKDVFIHSIGAFSDVNYGNTSEKPYNFNVKDIGNKIDTKLKNMNIEVPLKIYIVPYECKDFPEGEMQYMVYEQEENYYELGIILFNNDMPMVEQFDIQFNEYLEEVKWINNINQME